MCAPGRPAEPRGRGQSLGRSPLAAGMRVGSPLPTCPSHGLSLLLRKREFLREQSEVTARRQRPKGRRGPVAEVGERPGVGDEGARTVARGLGSGSLPGPPHSPSALGGVGGHGAARPEDDLPGRGLRFPASRRRAAIGGPRGAGRARGAHGAPWVWVGRGK